jgi:glucose-6-phosphate-specific signal transduction histidine kinase
MLLKLKTMQFTKTLFVLTAIWLLLPNPNFGMATTNRATVQQDTLTKKQLEEYAKTSRNGVWIGFIPAALLGGAISVAETTALVVGVFSLGIGLALAFSILGLVEYFQIRKRLKTSNFTSKPQAKYRKKRLIFYSLLMLLGGILGLATVVLGFATLPKLLLAVGCGLVGAICLGASGAFFHQKPHKKG